MGDSIVAAQALSLVRSPATHRNTMLGNAQAGMSLIKIMPNQHRGCLG